jgi:hypothetical protein
MWYHSCVLWLPECNYGDTYGKQKNILEIGTTAIYFLSLFIIDLEGFGKQ